MTALTDQLAQGLNSPICLTWEWTYACDLQCVHCLSSSGRRDPRELTTAEMKGIVDQLAEMQVFYVNIGGGEPMLRPDFFEIVEYCVDHGVGVKFSTNGGRITPRTPGGWPPWTTSTSRSRSTASTRRPTTSSAARAPTPGPPGHGQPPRRRATSSSRSSVVMTRQNVDQLDAYEALADEYGAELRLTRFRPSGRGIDTWHELHPTAEQQRAALPLAARPAPRADRRLVLPPLGPTASRSPASTCAAPAGSSASSTPSATSTPARSSSTTSSWPARCATPAASPPSGARRTCSPRCASRRAPGACASCGSFDACRGGCMAAKFFTGLPLDGPDPECVLGHGEAALKALEADGGAVRPTVSADHSKPAGVGRRRIPVSTV